MHVGKNYTLFACWSMFFWSISLRSVFYSLVPVIALTLDLSPSESGILVGGFFLGYAAAVFSTGFLPGGHKTVIMSGALLSVCAYTILSRLHSYPLFLLVAPLSSFGMGLYQPRGVSLIAGVSKGHDLGRNMSIHELAATAGLSLGPLFVGYILRHLSWENILLIWVLVGVFALVVFFRLSYKEPVGGQPTPETGVKDREAQGTNIVMCIYLILIAAAMFTLLMGLVSILPLMLVEKWGLSPDDAATFVGRIQLTMVVGIFSAGPLSDRYGRFRVLLYALAASLVVLLVMGFFGFGRVFTVCIVLMLISVAGTPPVYYAALAELYSGRTRDRFIGIISGIASLLGVVGTPAMFGYLIEHYRSSVTFWVAAGIALAGLIVTLQVERRLRNC